MTNFRIGTLNLSKLACYFFIYSTCVVVAWQHLRIILYDVKYFQNRHNIKTVTDYYCLWRRKIILWYRKIIKMVRSVSCDHIIINIYSILYSMSYIKVIYPKSYMDVIFLTITLFINITGRFKCTWAWMIILTFWGRCLRGFHHHLWDRSPSLLLILVAAIRSTFAPSSAATPSA